MPDTKLDQLRKAYAEATSAKGRRKVNGKFTHLACALMPHLLAAVEHLDRLVGMIQERKFTWREADRAKRTLNKLKEKD